MNRKLIQRGLAIFLAMSLISACAGQTPEPAVTVLPPPPTQPPSNPQPNQPQPAINLPTATKRPPTSIPNATTTFLPSPTLPPPIDRPFIMKISRVSVIVGRGILLEGHVVNGKMVAGGSVEIITKQGELFGTSLLAILSSNIPQAQVSVGDYASFLVSGVEPTDLGPGMLLVQAGEFGSYQEALLQLP